jgi:spore germination protein GerM
VHPQIVSTLTAAPAVNLVAIVVLGDAQELLEDVDQMGGGLA